MDRIVSSRLRPRRTWRFAARSAHRDCVGDGLPEPTIFQAGFNADYIVLARHPRRLPEPANRSISEFYYVTRTSYDSDSRKPISVTGPLDELEFDREKTRLQLPEFGKVFGNLTVSSQPETVNAAQRRLVGI